MLDGFNGHTYALFGPLSNGATTVLVEKPISLIDINFFKKNIKFENKYNISACYINSTNKIIK